MKNLRYFIEKMGIGLLASVLCLISMTGITTPVYAQSDLSVTITVFVTDDNLAPMDGTHTIILQDGSNQVKAQNYGNTASFTVSLPANQDVRTYLIYQEQSNPDGYAYDTSVYGLSLVANYNHTALDAIDIEKNGSPYEGNIYFTNSLKPAGATEPTAANPTDAAATTDATATPAPDDTATTTDVPQDAMNEDESDYTADGNVYEREHALYGVATSMSETSTTFVDEDGNEYVLLDKDVKIATEYQVNDKVTVAFNGTAEDMKDVVIGQNIRVVLTENEDDDTSASVSPSNPKSTPAPTAEATASPDTEPIQATKTTNNFIWIALGLLGVGILLLLVLILLLSRKGKEAKPTVALQPTAAATPKDEELMEDIDTLFKEIPQEAEPIMEEEPERPVEFMRIEEMKDEVQIPEANNTKEE